ncbi:Hypothetical predicted protein [Cloeon dipterum]|uniref:Peroxisomal ATPase PEX6 n=2 Tax=Cloeon dipterum TaxID=197152 RepID=A0A8S1DA81_9INSE|nr:Hypothetical predicted protein [Cloeon dipterum]
MLSSGRLKKTVICLQVLRYMVRIVGQIRMSALERRVEVVPVAVPTEVFKDYLGDNELDENHSVIVHPEVARILQVKSLDWIWIHFSEELKILAKIVTSDFILQNDVILPDALFFNGTAGSCDKDQLVLSPSLLEKLPKAVTFDVSIQACPTGWDASDIDTLLAEYFKIPRPICIFDVFCISVKNYAPEMFYSKLNVDLDADFVWFKVESVATESGGSVDKCKRLCFEASRQQTMVALVQSTGGGIPGKLDCFLGHKEQYLELEKAVKVYLDSKYYKVLHQGRGLLIHGKAGCEELYRAVAKNLGLTLIIQNCRELNMPSGSAGQIEGKLKQLVAKVTAKNSPSLIVFDNIEVLGHDHESTNAEAEDFRLTTCLSTILSSLPAGKCAVLGVTSRPKSVNPSIGRSWLLATTIPVQHPSDPESCLRQLLARHGFYQKNIPIALPKMGLREMAFLTRKLVESQVDPLIKEFNQLSSTDNRKEQLSEFSRAKLGAEIEKKHWVASIEMLKISCQEVVSNIPKVYWEDIGGLEEVRKEVLRTVSLPIKFPFLRKSGLKRSGILLYGPPGTGKTLVAKAVATECGLSFISVKGAELLSMYVGQSEENVRDVFMRARQVAPSVIFFDELDALAPSRGQGGDGGGNVSDRVVSQLMAEMDGIEQNLNNAPVFVMAATNRVDLVETALLRPGRFDKLMYVGPSKSDEAKLGVLRALTRKFSFCDNVQLEKVIEELPDAPLTGADLYGLCASAWKNALRQRINQIQNDGTDDKSTVSVSQENFIEAAQNLRTSVSPAELEAYEQEARKQNIQ